jgi:superfamily II RNA helicase
VEAPPARGARRGRGPAPGAGVGAGPLTLDLPDDRSPDAVVDAFVAWATEQGLTLYPAQEEALLALVSGEHVVLSTPTGSGKSLVATAAHFAALAEGRRSFYTAPLKALVSEKFFALCDVFGADQVGMLTGDASVNPAAPIVCATAEVLANLALREGRATDAGVVVMDEFHYYADPDRGWAWQVPLLELVDAQLLLMSATLGDTTDLRSALTRRTGRPATEVSSVDRPVPLTFSFSLQPVHDALTELLETHQAPVYVVHPTQAGAVEQAQALMSVNVCTREEKDAIATELGAFRFAKGFGPVLSRLLRHGIGVHHAGMLPKYRRVVERLTQAGLLKVVCGTDTLGVGINVPIRTVLMTSLSKYDGTKVRLLTAREFHQVAGRAGRAGYDTAGYVVVQAPQHVIDNERAVAKAAGDPKKLRSIKKKTPPQGMVSWGKPTFDRLVAAEPEPLRSQMRVSHSMLLQLASRGPGAVSAAKRLLLDNDEPRSRQRVLVRQAVAAYRSLLAAGVVERVGPDEVRVTVDLQREFALNQPLSPFALAALELLDPASDSFALDVVSVIEATLDDPRQVLSAQRHKARGEAVAELKAQGMEYEERMERLEEVEHPKPLVDLLEPAYELYAGGHPWVRDHELRPKSVVRDLWERAMTFTEYVGFYGLARSEGLVLRYLADAYRALRQTVPAGLRTPELDDLLEWLGELVRQVDSSLLDEWSELVSGVDAALPVVPVASTPPPVTRNERAFRVLVRNALFRRVELFALRRPDLLAELGDEVDWTAAMEAYFAEYQLVGTGPDARGPALFSYDGSVAVQVLDDPAGDRDWRITAVVDTAASDEAGEPVLTEVRIGPATAS